MKMREDKPNAVVPSLDDLLPNAADQVAFEEAGAALEAGRLVRHFRLQAGLTQVDLARRLSVTQTRLSAIERGNGRDGPSYSLLKRISIACKMDWPWADVLDPSYLEARTQAPKQNADGPMDHHDSGAAAKAAPAKLSANTNRMNVTAKAATQSAAKRNVAESERRLKTVVKTRAAERKVG